MADYNVFPTTRTTPADPVALLSAVRAAANDPAAGIGLFTGAGYRVKTVQPLTAPQLTAVQAAIDTAPELTPQRSAQNAIDTWPLELQALALALIDETNRLRAALTVLGAPNLPPVTKPQALAAVRAKAGLL